MSAQEVTSVREHECEQSHKGFVLETHIADAFSSTGTQDAVCDYAAKDVFTGLVGQDGNFHLLQSVWRNWN